MRKQGKKGRSEDQVRKEGDGDQNREDKAEKGKGRSKKGEKQGRTKIPVFDENGRRRSNRRGNRGKEEGNWGREARKDPNPSFFAQARRHNDKKTTIRE